MHTAFYATISGRVQLVMYRDFVQRKARSLKVVGEVHNEPNGTVSVIAEGEQKNLEKLLTLLKRGSILARVKDVDVQWKDATNVFTDFSIRF